jgi:hypothetical protein
MCSGITSMNAPTMPMRKAASCTELTVWWNLMTYMAVIRIAWLERMAWMGPIGLSVATARFWK